MWRGKGGWKDEGREGKVDCMRWMEAREGGYKRREIYSGVTWSRLLKESEKNKNKNKIKKKENKVG